MSLMFCLSVSEYVISISQFFLGLVWLLEGDFRQKLARVKNSTGFWVLVSYMGIHLLGLLYSTDLNYALNDLRIKLPLLLIPFFVASQPEFEAKELRLLFSFFLLGLLVSSGFTFFNLETLRSEGVTDVRDASVFVSHIRLSLMLILGVVICWFYAFFKTNSLQVRGVLFLLSLWFIYFILQMQMLTGLFVLLASLLVSIPWALARLKNRRLKFTGLFVVVGAFVMVSFVVFNASKTFIYPSNNPLLEKTQEGHRYFHDSLNFQLENGNRVWDNICEMELNKSWNKRSIIDYNQQGNSGQFIRETLIRYLSSRGLPKESASVIKLTNEEIVAIENGTTNYKYIDGVSLEKRIYETTWELHSYLLNDDNPSGNSVAQRLEFWRVAIHVFKQNWLIGVGTGDLVTEMQVAYDSMESVLNDNYRLKPHNQYLTSMICFGVFGLIQLAGLLIWSIHKTKHSILALVFITIAAASMLTEDTLETQVGATFVALFLALFVVGHPGPIEPIDHKTLS